jgi:predicted kinase
MPKLIMTKGLPASGKTTWAKKQKAKRVNKDDIRAMLDDGVWNKPNEKIIVQAERLLARQLLMDGHDVIVDNTHLGGDHEEFYQNLAETAGYDYEVKDFTDVPLSTCLKRDSERANSVGEKVIKSMYNTYLRQKSVVAPYAPPPFDPDLPNCIIVDIDGTLAHMTGRSPYDYSKVQEDVVDENVREIVIRYSGRGLMDEVPSTYIIIVSGREDGCKDVTEQWLADNSIPYDEIHMRKHGDLREDSIVKKEIYEEWIKPRYNVRFVLDDRNRVVEMWRELGLKCLQVAPGDF